MSEKDQRWLATVRSKGDYREFVGPTDEYDVNGALQFSLLTSLGMRESHLMLDIGCGSLRSGRLFMMYLRPGHYCAIEPESWLVEAAIQNEIGADMVRLKSPAFYHGRDFSCRYFGRTFDFILAQGVFTHAPQQDIMLCMSEAAACMGKTSLFLATFMEGDHDYDGRDWLYPSVSRYTWRRIRQMTEGAGLRHVSIPWPHPRGAKWIALSRPEREPGMRDLVGGLPSRRPCSRVALGTGLTTSLRRRILGR